jgi:nucleoid DNA-binding protein
MSVREAEALVDSDRGKPGSKAPAAVKDADTRALEKALSDALGLTVAINHGKGGGEVRIVGFGNFVVAHRKASTGRNPRTGESINIPASSTPKFRPGKALKDAVNS